VSQSIPFDRQIWTGQECAVYLGQSYSQFMKRTQYLLDFPKRCPIPGQPRWSAQAVSDWALGVTNESRTEVETIE